MMVGVKLEMAVAEDNIVRRDEFLVRMGAPAGSIPDASCCRALEA